MKKINDLSKETIGTRTVAVIIILQLQKKDLMPFMYIGVQIKLS